MSNQSTDKNEERYHSLFNNMAEGFARCQMLYKNDEPIDFKYLEVNNAFEKLTDLKKVVGKRISEILVHHKTENPKLFNLYERVSRTGVSEHIETFVVALEKWFSISVYSSQKGQFLVIFNNITKRKESEELLRINEVQFRGLFIQSHVPTAIVSLDRCIIKCNEAFCLFLGYSEKEMIGKTIAYFTYPKDREIGMNEINRITKEEIEFASVKKRYLRKEGTIVWGKLTISMVRSADNKPLYYLPIIQDITETYKVDKALKESETRFKQLIENSFDMISLMDPEGTQNYISESCEKILGYKQEELIGISIIEKMIHPEDKEASKKALLNIIENKANGGIIYRHLHKNGTWVYLEAYGTNQLDNPIIKSIVLNVRDVTERKKAELILKKSESTLKELNKTKDKLFSIIAHDLRSPFNTILGFSELLIENTKDLEVAKSEKYLGFINSSAKSTLILLDNLLNWAKLQTKQINFNPEKIILDNIIHEIIDISISTAKIKNISIDHIQSNEIKAYTDLNILKIILRNLISNAIKFTNLGGSIKVKATQKNNFIEVTVSDNGLGMDEKVLTKLFKIDTTITSIGTAAEKGSGLGLLLCKEFVEKQGGKIWVESKLGEGSDFKFTLPLNPMETTHNSKLI